MRAGVEGRLGCFEAQVMDVADDVAYSVHDVEDGVVAGRIDLGRLDLAAVTQTVREWYEPGTSEPELAEALARVRSVDSWPATPYDRTRRHLAALKNLTSDLIGRWCGAVRQATFEHQDGPFVRHRARVVVPPETSAEMALLKGIAAHYVMRADDRRVAMERQRALLGELVEALLRRAPDALDRPFADDWAQARDDAARHRTVIDQVASLTDASAVTRHGQLCGPAGTRG
jgi:dGTPase